MRPLIFLLYKSFGTVLSYDRTDRKSVFQVISALRYYGDFKEIVQLQQGVAVL